MNPHFGTYIYAQKRILLIENLLKKPCSAENSNHYQDAFWHIYICTEVWVHFPMGFSTEKKCHFDTHIYIYIYIFMYKKRFWDRVQIP